jgi:hypothetical protein
MNTSNRDCKRIIFTLAVVFSFYVFPAYVMAQDSVSVWYGNPDGSPLIAPIGSMIRVDVWIDSCPPIISIAICLGVNDSFITDFQSFGYGSIYEPLSSWDDPQFMDFAEHHPPNHPGWSSNCFIGWADVGGPPNPPLRALRPQKILTMVIVIADDPLLIGDTVNCMRSGISHYFGHSGANGAIDFREHFSPLCFVQRPETCDYIPGDINGDGTFMGIDITYGLFYLKGHGMAPPDSCYHPDLPGNHWLHSAGDINGNCEFTGADLIWLSNYITNPGRRRIQWCVLTPPIW